MAGDTRQHADLLRKVPAQRRAEETVRVIFQAVAQILEGEGEEALTTNRIAERSGYSVGTIYQYFPDKKAIVLLMIRRERRRVMDELHALMSEAERSSEHPSRYLRLFVRTLIQAFAVGRWPRRVMLKMAWRMDSEPDVMSAMQEMAQRIGEAILARRHPALREPTHTSLFVVTRGVMGAIRAAVLEDLPLASTQEFEDELVRMAWVMIGIDVPPEPPAC